MLYLLIGALLIIAGSACSSDSDCIGSTNPVCDTTSSISSCKQCLDSTDCEDNSWYANQGKTYCELYTTTGGGYCTTPPTDGDCSTDSDCTNSLTPVCDTSLLIATCVACEDSTDCQENSSYYGSGKTECDTSSLYNQCVVPGSDTDSDACTDDSDCTSEYGSGAICVSGSSNYCKPYAKECSADSDCIASSCTTTAYFSYCEETVCINDLGCSYVSGDNVACSGSVTSAGTCYQACETDTDCDVDGYECQSSACVYDGSTSTSSSGVDQLAIFMTMIVIMINGLFIIM